MLYFRRTIKKGESFKMQKAKKNNKFLFIALVFMIMSAFVMSFLPTTNISTLAADDTGIFNNTLTGVTMDVNAYGDNHGQVNHTTKDVTISGEGLTKELEAKSYAWSKVKYFSISLSGLDSLADKASGAYNYEYKVTYFPQTISGTGTLEYDLEANSAVTAYSYSAETKDTIKNQLYFFVDDNIQNYKTSDMSGDKKVAVGAVTVNAETDKQETIFNDSYIIQGGWGVYAFTFSCDGETSGQFVYELVPTNLSDLKDTQLKVNYEIVKSTTSNNNAYLFYVNDEFQYINREYISWSIKGEGSDGTKYVSFDYEKTADNETSLYTGTDVKNTGVSFKFDKPIQGNWEATATIKDGTTERKATSEEVSTIKPFSTTAIVIIVSVVTVVAVAIVAVIIVVTIKKERTW